jgi:hypothetical protein
VWSGEWTDQSPQSGCRCLVRFIVVMYVDHFAFTGNFLVSSMRVFHALSAEKIVPPPTDGGGPDATEADPPRSNQPRSSS